MRGIEIEPLEDEHLDQAARLLADRHARHRRAETLLPEVAYFRAQLERDLDHERAAGLVALRRGNVVDFAGCAAAPRRTEAIRDLYAALAARWVAAGATRHIVAVPASDEALADPWLRLAFGVQLVWAVRETAAMKPVEAGVRIRPGTPEDLDLVARLDRILYEHQAGSPSFSGVPIPSDEEFRAEWSDLWDQSAEYTHFVAERAGRPVGHVVLFRRPTGDLRVPERSIDLSHAATLPAVRRSGVNLALTGHALTWATNGDFGR